ncbi:MAG: hypothetical protein LBB38_00795 [Puniceicoccales bacterium]|nr:hypothetical protein [Puniceicoccales bacterium]
MSGDKIAPFQPQQTVALSVTPSTPPPTAAADAASSFNALGRLAAENGIGKLSIIWMRFRAWVDTFP